MRAKQPKTLASILSRQPLIIYVRPRPRPFGLATIAARQLAGRPCVAIIRVMWSIEIPYRPAYLARAFHRKAVRRAAIGAAYRLAYLAGAYHLYRRRYPNMRIIIAANTGKERDHLRALGVETIDANHNIFVDEMVFKPLPAIEPKFDAVYNANFSAFKRRHLAAEIPTCIHIGYVADPSKRGDRLAELDRVKAQFPHHHFANPLKHGTVRRMPASAVNASLALARVGLCLSAAEGAMTSSMEYLLAGLPIVSTPSRGGRDRYFHPDTALIVDPDPRSVREAVAALIARNIPREHVRQTTLKLIAPERQAFNAFIDKLRDGHPPAGRDPRWSFDYVPNLYQRRPVEEFLAEIEAADMPHSLHTSVV
jgi:glycosyltransferase involved in cell wall biosynthesis